MSLVSDHCPIRVFGSQVVDADSAYPSHLQLVPSACPCAMNTSGGYRDVMLSLR